MSSSNKESMQDSHKVVTIDGPAGAGKSTVAQSLARKLGFFYLDTGAMYRALTLKALREGVDLESEDDLVALAQGTTIDLQWSTDGIKVVLDGEDVTGDIRSTEVTNKTFYIARTPEVRKIMVGWQRAIAKKENVVIEGRDTGTVVFPDADFKFYLDAKPRERARRRYEELKAKGEEVDLSRLTSEIEERDRYDLTRDVGPLKRAEDAVCVDTTGMSVEQVAEELLKKITA